jgi:PAS domain S-box-containing protein
VTDAAAEHPLPRAGWRTRLASRLAVAFFLPAAAVVVFAATVGFIEMRSALRESAFDRLRAATDVREGQFDRWVREQTNDLRFLATMPQLQEGITAAARAGTGAAALDAMLRRSVSTQQDFTRIVLLSAVGGRVFAASDSTLLGQYRVSERHFLEGRTRVVVQNVYPAPATGMPTLTIAMPVLAADGTTIAVLAGDANLARVEEVVADRSGLGETGDAYLVDRFHEFVRGNDYDRQRFPRGIHTPAIDRAVSGISGAGVYRNYAGREVVGVYRWMPARQLALFAEMSTDEAFAPARRLVWEMMLIGALAVLTLALGLMFVARHIARPVLEIADAAERVAGGNLTTTAPVRTADEIGQLAAAFNVMTRRLAAAHGALEAQLHATESAAEATEASRRLLRALIDHLPALVAVKDLDGRYLITNASFGDFHRVPAVTLLGRSPAEVLPQANAIAIAECDAQVLATGATLTAEETHVVGSQERAFLTARFPLRDADGRIFAIGVVATDITERKRLESQVLHQQKLEAVGRLAGGVAHDMNNLLTAVRCNAELLLDGMAPDHPDRQPLEEIDRSVRNGSALTRQLLTFSRAHVVRPSALDVNRILGGMTAMLRRYVGTGIEMRFDLADDLWLVRADEGQMEQVLLNLLSNAHDAMPVGGTATVATENVVVGGPTGVVVPNLAAGEYVRLGVHDTGTGIDPELLPLLFEPFFTTKEPGRGTGLGLSTAYAIVQQALGAITIDSVLGRGTTFNVYLPRHPDEPFVAPEPLPPRVAPGSGEMLLVIDDEAPVRTALRRMLALQGYRIVEAQSGRDALALFQEHGDAIALVLTDVFMPEMNGPEIAARLHEQRPSLPVIFMSGYTASEIVRRGLMREETRFLQKPFNRPQLVDLVAEMLRKTQIS